MGFSYLLFKSLPKERDTKNMKRLTYAELVAYISTINAANYADKRNYIDGSTRLSEYITRGAISLPAIRDIILETNSKEKAYKLLNELSWREYWQLVWQTRGNDIFGYIRPAKSNLRPGIPTAVLEANTGIKALDDGIMQLQDTGYIHNHMRMWIAGMICNVAQCDWRTAADWMHSYLIDGDYASNHLSWQWVAGSYTGKSYLPQQDNINAYTKSIQRGTFLDQPYEVIADMPVPKPLEDITNWSPHHNAKLPSSTITINKVMEASEILLYSPWTLDPNWRSDSQDLRLLLLDSNMFTAQAFSQNVIDSIMWFAAQIPNLEILYDIPETLRPISDRIIRKHYAGIMNWPGVVEPSELLHPQVPIKFYPSFSAYWKKVAA